MDACGLAALLPSLAFAGAKFYRTPAEETIAAARARRAQRNPPWQHPVAPARGGRAPDSAWPPGVDRALDEAMAFIFSGGAVAPEHIDYERRG